MIDSLVVNDSIQSTALEFVIQGQPFFLLEGEVADLGGVTASYNEQASSVISFTKKGLAISAETQVEGQYLDMSKLTPEDRMNPARLDSMAIAIPRDTAFRLEAGRLYSFGASQ